MRHTSTMIETQAGASDRLLPLRTMELAYPSLDNCKVHYFECYLPSEITTWQFPLPRKGVVNGEEAAALAGVKLKTLSSWMPELQALGIKHSCNCVHLSTFLFLNMWVFGMPDRQSRAELLNRRATDRVRLGVETLSPGRKAVQERERILKQLGNDLRSRATSSGQMKLLGSFGEAIEKRHTPTEAVIDELVRQHGGRREELYEAFATDIAEERQLRLFVDDLGK